MDQDIDTSGQPGPDDDPAGKAPFAANDEPMEVESEETADPAEEAAKLQSDLEELDIDGDDVPAPDGPESKTENPAEIDPIDVGDPPLWDEGAPPGGAFPDGPDLSAELPGSDAKRAEGLPDFDDLDDTEKRLEAFGGAANDFNGGEDDPKSLDFGGDDNDSDPAQQLMDSDIDNRSKMSDMLIEHARRIDEITRGLEGERL